MHPVKYGYLERITALFISDTELSSVCAETAKIPKVFKLKIQTEVWNLALDDIDHSYYICCNWYLLMEYGWSLWSIGPDNVYTNMHNT